MDSPVPDGDRIHRRQLNQLVSWTLGERLRWSWYRLRMFMGETNYASWCLYGGFTALPADAFPLDQPGAEG
jgi:hypothetical protein